MCSKFSPNDTNDKAKAKRSVHFAHDTSRYVIGEELRDPSIERYLRLVLGVHDVSRETKAGIGTRSFAAREKSLQIETQIRREGEPTNSGLRLLGSLAKLSAARTRVATNTASPAIVGNCDDRS